MEPIKGFSDYTGEEAIKRDKIKSIIAETFKLYNFEPAETPIIEEEKFVKGENINDEAVSDIYKLEDKGKRKLALRYEFTFQLKRLSKNKKLPYRRYQIGPVFRDEPTGVNRVRQITQCDIDIVGSTIKDEAEILNVMSEILKKLNIDFVINVNNRKLLNEILEELKIPENKKLEVIREIDKLDKLPKEEVNDNLKKLKADKSLEIFSKPEKFFEKYKSYEEILELKKACELYDIKINFCPFLARGLSYYNGNIFEIKTKEIKETICAGGSYLVNGIQSTGISTSIERLTAVSKIKIENKKFLIISLNQDKLAIELARKIRNKNISCSVFFGKPSKALDYANSYNIQKVIFIGDEEIKKKKYKLKDMNTGKESYLTEKQLEKID
ncbi:MAG: ATP phosphoribosyltransferase regulatory subunit [Candidatus Pacearchaeota archaeon]